MGTILKSYFVSCLVSTIIIATIFFVYNPGSLFRSYLIAHGNSTIGHILVARKVPSVRSDLYYLFIQFTDSDGKVKRHQYYVSRAIYEQMRNCLFWEFPAIKVYYYPTATWLFVPDFEKEDAWGLLQVILGGELAALTTIFVWAHMSNKDKTFIL